jgi:hypothetical protein
VPILSKDLVDLEACNMTYAEIKGCPREIQRSFMEIKRIDLGDILRRLYCGRFAAAGKKRGSRKMDAGSVDIGRRSD